MPTQYTTRRIIPLICIALMALVFVSDLYTPRGIAHGVLYGIPVLLTLLAPSRRITLLAAACATPLVLVGGYLSPDGGIAIIVPLINRSMALLVIWSIALLVLQRKTLDAELRRNSSRLAEAQRIAHLGYWEWDIVNDKLYWSEQVYQIFGIDPQTFPANFQSFLDYLHPDDRATLLEAVTSAIAQRGPYTLVYRIIRPDGNERVLFTRGTASHDADGSPLRTLGTVQDITERRRLEQDLQMAHDTLESTVVERTKQLEQANSQLKAEIVQREQTEAALKASRLRLRTVISNAPVIVFMLDAQGVYQLIEGPGLADIGFRSEEIIGRSAFTVFADAPQILTNIRRALAGENVASITLYRDTWFDTRYSVLYDAQGAVTGAIGVSTNITAQKLAEQSRLEALQLQRDTLIREVHHRIKNNLQGVTGLLRQQSLAHPELRPILEQTIAQVHSVAIVHGLHSERPRADIMLCDMLQAISHSLNEIAHDFVPLHLDLSVVKPIQVAKDEAVPMALIMNELMTNALKHSASGGAAGPVTVRLQGDCEAAHITVNNAGVLPTDFSLAARSGIGTGLNLVLALLPHSGASLAITQERSAVVTARVMLTPPVICNVVADDA